MQAKEGPSDDQRLTALTAVAADLKTEIAKLNTENVDNVIKLSDYTKRTRRMAWGLVISMALDLVLTLIITNNAIRLDHLTERLNIAQTVNRQKALCPLYQLFLDSKSDVGRQRAPDPVKYDQAFVVILDGYSALHCTEFIQKQP